MTRKRLRLHIFAFIPCVRSAHALDAKVMLHFSIQEIFGDINNFSKVALFEPSWEKKTRTHREKGKKVVVVFFLFFPTMCLSAHGH